jgi:integrase
MKKAVKAKLRDQIGKLKALATHNPNLHEAGAAREKIQELEVLLSPAVRGLFEKTPGSKVWWIRFTDAQGRYRREKVGAYSLAAKLLDKRRAEAVQGKKLPETLRRRVVAFGEIADDALAYSKDHKKSYADDCSRMKLLKVWWENRDADSLETSELEQRLADESRAKAWAPSTFNHYRSLLMLVYREAKRAKKVTNNPARDIRHRKEDNGRIRFFGQFATLPTEIDYLKPHTTEEARLRAVIAHEHPEHVQEFELAMATGLRMGSMYLLTWEMLDWDGRMLNIPISKNGERLHIPLNNAAMAALRAVYQRGQKSGRIFRSEKTGEPLDNWRHWIGKAVKKAGLVDFRGHDLRHCFASRLRMKGAKLEDIGELLGHKSLTMTKRYSHLGPNQLHQVAALLDSDSTPVAPAANSETATPASFVN